MFIWWVPPSGSVVSIIFQLNTLKDMKTTTKVPLKAVPIHKFWLSIIFNMMNTPAVFQETLLRDTSSRAGVLCFVHFCCQWIQYLIIIYSASLLQPSTYFKKLSQNFYLLVSLFLLLHLNATLFCYLLIIVLWRKIFSYLYCRSILYWMLESQLILRFKKWKVRMTQKI